MHRDRFTEKLVSIVGAIEAKTLPFNVRELYVFGSYSRGAIEPGDLDLILVHDPPPKEFNKRILAELRADGVPSHDFRRIHSRLESKYLATIRKPGERVQVIRADSLENATGEGSRINREDAVLIWSSTDRNWRAKLNSIQPDEAAGRAPRKHIVPLTRVNASVREMEIVVNMIEHEQLAFTRIAVDSIDLDLDADHKQWLAHWTKCKVMGKKSMETLPYAMWWLQSHGLRCSPPFRTNILSECRTHRVEVGRPSLWAMIWTFLKKRGIERQCLIPHFMKKQPNELLVIERGRAWDGFKEGDPNYDRLLVG